MGKYHLTSSAPIPCFSGSVDKTIWPAFERLLAGSQFHLPFISFCYQHMIATFPACTGFGWVLHVLCHHGWEWVSTLLSGGTEEGLGWPSCICGGQLWPGVGEWEADGGMRGIIYRCDLIPTNQTEFIPWSYPEGLAVWLFPAWVKWIS